MFPNFRWLCYNRVAYIYLTGIDLRLGGCMHGAHCTIPTHGSIQGDSESIKQAYNQTHGFIPNPAIIDSASFLCPYPSYLYISKESFPWLVVLSPAVYTITYKCRFGLWNVWLWIETFDFGVGFFPICMAWYSTNISTEQLNHRDFCGFKGRVKNRTPF